MNLQIWNRQCGDCDLCCTTMFVRELGKQPHCDCKHLKQKPGVGCGIYESRPASCRRFECMWRKGIVKDEELRPDRIGIILSMERDARITGGRALISFYESAEGAVASDISKALIEEWSAHELVLLNYRDSSKEFVGPAALVKRATQRINLLSGRGELPGNWESLRASA